LKVVPAVIVVAELGGIVLAEAQPGRGVGPAGLVCVIIAGVGRCVMIGAHVQRMGRGTLGGNCRVAGRKLSARCHV